MPQDIPRDWYEKQFANLDFSILEKGSEAPKEETVPEETEEGTVFLQKIISEIWIYTDTENKTYGTVTSQNIEAYGEMTKEEAMQIIGDKKRRRRKKSE